MSSTLSSLQSSNVSSKSDGVVELLESVEKIKILNSENPLKRLFSQTIKPTTLKEKFLCATFEIIAEKGADALSASELIRRTKSSKGALFHHFQTIDHLCIESLQYFKQQVNAGFVDDKSENIEEYLKYIMKDFLYRNSSRYFVHLRNFFRDRAVRDERYSIAFKELYDAYTSVTVRRILSFLSAEVDIQAVHKKVLFFMMTIESISYHRVLFHQDSAFETELNELLESTTTFLKQLK